MMMFIFKDEDSIEEEDEGRHDFRVRVMLVSEGRERGFIEKGGKISVLIRLGMVIRIH